ncbi:succinate dehydrogenase, hydrophobic membrane anchor protein [Phaeobacter gallaeciensis]|uniref:Succinate dehydrogenase hydrophobic membrane anchor subunit n=2 Tax=Roseobacteraceae TaxID=2854170 RepID=A0A366WM17_9RHOB|nr:MULTISPECIES: succinate dehydrogenase, hydrophobic membrane anchor protein [Roseobacteraceae]MBT3141511.1 succinate dehydrogenase, hydrophobic membrane anchor protein [Falsiruegeria litorea]MBT8167347.1 succinate dehydrogenase, hydrophobic membrane anchor protein [Falsiruegeria litorea]RBW50920.1 succinate dehydrogenase, hydrophobic membrane anchor protein [Phaeobacter gallaeciensis]
MKYLTDRKRAQGLGAGRQGTHHHWQMMVSSAALVILVPLFVLTFGYGLGGTYEEVLAYYSQPFPAIVSGLTLIVVVLHLMHEAQVAIEDYVHGVAEKLTLMGVAGFSYTLIAVGLFALAKLAL